LSFDRPLSPEECIQEVDAKPSFHWVAVSDSGEDIGAITVSRAPRVVCGERTNWRLRLIAVDPRWRRRGIGNALLKTGADAVADLDETAFWGSVRVPLLPWFESIGAVAELQEYDLPPMGPHRNVLVRLADFRLT
jgi:predicted N-acetyltransferase YhbS